MTIPARTWANGKDTEEARALLQARIALFWKVLFFLMLVASVLGAVGAFKHPGADLVVDVALATLAALLWWLCHRGQRSVQFSRTLEAGGLVLFFSGASLLGVMS